MLPGEILIVVEDHSDWLAHVSQATRTPHFQSSLGAIALVIFRFCCTRVLKEVLTDKFSNIFLYCILYSLTFSQLPFC
jgi:hypothetical protein